MELESVVNRIRNEFIEMPGLKVSIPQAMRLWGLERAECDEVIDVLVKRAFLRMMPDGYVTRAA